MKPNFLITISILLFTSLFTISYTAPAYADYYPYNSTIIPTFSWTSVSPSTRMVIGDIDRNGIADTVYTITGTTVTKQFGRGISSFTMPAGTTSVMDISQNRILTMGLPSNAVVISKHVDLLTGSIVESNSMTACGGAPSTNTMTGGLINSKNGTVIGDDCSGPTFHKCTVTFPLYNDTNSCGGSAASVSHFLITLNSGAIVYSATVNQNYTGVAAFTTNRTGTVLATAVTAFPEPSTSIDIDYHVQLMYRGQVYPTNYVLSNTLLTQRMMPVSITNVTSVINYIPSVLLNPTFTTYPQYFFLESGSTLYLGAIFSNTLYYTPLQPIQDWLNSGGYAWTLYTVKGKTFNLNTAGINTAQSIDALTIVKPDSTTLAQSLIPRTILPSPYVLRDITNREYDPRFSNTISEILPINEEAAGSNPIFFIKNAPVSGVIKVVSTSKFYLSVTPFIYAITFIQSDHYANVDLPSGECVKVYAGDGSLPIIIWSDLGTVCNSGISPKTLVYTSGLQFTFWELPWGTTTNYDGATDTLQTMVRHDTTPFQYYINVYNKNGTLQISQFHNASALDIQSFNVSGVQKPARVEILDADNVTLHFATLGNGNYLQGFQAWSNQYLTIDGFNLLAMMPLIFAGMWTRNTVGIGTVVTVIMIATLVWFGVLQIPEIIIYLMLFIGAVGMIAYKLYS